MNDLDKIKYGKLRGGRPTIKYKDKKKYNRKKDKNNIKKDLKSLYP